MKQKIYLLFMICLVMFTLTSCKGKFVVSFNTNGGIYIEDIKVKNKKNVEKPLDPSKEGYIFGGWILDGSEFDFSTPITKDIILDAVWLKTTAVIKFDTMGGTLIDQQEVLINDKVEKPTNPTKEGYNFICWTLNDELYDFNQPVTKDFTLVAKWGINQYLVNFNANGGTNVDSQIIDYKGKVVAPEIPIKENYTFVEWQLNGKTYDFDLPIEDNITLEAIWSLNEFTISFYTDEGTVIERIKVSVGTRLGDVLAKIDEPTMEGYNFMRWELPENLLIPSDKIVESDLVLHAVWAKKYCMLYLNYDNGTPNSSIAKVYGETLYYQSINIPTKDNHTFIEWQLNGETFNQDIVMTEDLTLKAIWRRDSYKVKFDTNGSDAVVPDQDVLIGECAEKVFPSKVDATFVEWQLNGKSFDFSKPVTDDITLVAVWETHSYLVTFINEYSTFVIPSQYVKIGECVEKPVDPTYPNKKFLGWFTTDGVEYDFTSPIIEPLTLTAKWVTTGYQSKWEIGHDVLNFDGRGMEFIILVEKIIDYDPFDINYSDAHKDIKQQHQRIVESYYNIKIIYEQYPDNAITDAERMDFLASKMVTNSNVYAYSVPSYYISKLAEKEVISPLYDLVNNTGIFKNTGLTEKEDGTYSIGYNQNAITSRLVTFKDKVYGYVKDIPRANYFMFYNSNMLQEAGLEDPATLWMKGEWTFSRFYQYVNELQAYLDTQGNDYYSLAINPGELVVGLAASLGYPIAEAKDEFSFNLTSDNVVEIFTRIQLLYQEGYMTFDGSAVNDSFLNKKSAFAHGGINYINNDEYFDSSKIDFTVGLVPYPTEEGQGGVPIITTNSDEAVKDYKGIPIEIENSIYIKGIDMSNSTYLHPLTFVESELETNDCFAILKAINSTNGIHSGIIFGIIFDLFAGLGEKGEEPRPSEEEEYQQSLKEKFESKIYIDVIMSVQNNIYPELIINASFRMGDHTHYTGSGLYGIAEKICKDSSITPKDELQTVMETYSNVLKNLVL